MKEKDMLHYAMLSLCYGVGSFILRSVAIYRQNG